MQPADLLTKGLGATQHHLFMTKIGVFDIYYPSVWGCLLNYRLLNWCIAIDQFKIVSWSLLGSENSARKVTWFCTSVSYSNWNPIIIEVAMDFK